MGIIYMTAALITVLLALTGEFKIVKPVFTDYIYYILIVLHFLWGLTGFTAKGRGKKFFGKILFLPELLLSISLLLFTFTYLYALAANMDYVQRFIATGGNLRLAIDTETERRIAIIRYIPLILAGIFAWVYPRIRYKNRAEDHFGSGKSFIMTGWAFGWIFISVALTVLAHPSFAVHRGVPVLGWFCMIPLFIVLIQSRPGRGIFYGIIYGVFSTALVNFWLGTFSLISLQAIILIYLVFYSVFIPLAIYLRKWTKVGSFLVLPIAWLLFDYIRTTGFLGYPWGTLGLSQYSITPVIQIAALTGVWGVNFLILLFNGGIAETVSAWIRGKRVLLPGIISFYFTAAVFVLGSIVLLIPVPEQNSHMKISLIQQNSDPRKNDYEETFNSLVRLTDAALEDEPELIVWPETAYVPNIARWSTEDLSQFSEGSWQGGLISLTRRFIQYQKEIETALLTGNDDYEYLVDEKGEEIHYDYNAAVLFSDEGERVETYHKIRLVPFTEHFPYKNQLPGVYKLLTEFDVNFWIPGEEKTVFRLGPMSFSTPICFEDAFPNEVREFVRAGAGVIINISNDYWSLTEVQGWQHFSASLFRSVENRRPLLRSTTSGITAWVDPYGRIERVLPTYVEGYLTVNLPVPETPPRTLYTVLGDWFPYFCGAVLLLLAAASFMKRKKNDQL